MKPITAEIRVNIPGYGTLRLPLDCAKLEPVQGGVEAWDENQNSIESWGQTATRHYVGVTEQAPELKLYKTGTDDVTKTC